ncbi:MAG: hypothetical protein AAGE18_04230 [Pseudomonadota bacterium]
MQKVLNLSVIGVALFALVACSASPGRRAVEGGALGAAVGTAGAAIAGGSLATGAIVGGAVGAATGVLTDQDQIDLDD